MCVCVWGNGGFWVSVLEERARGEEDEPIVIAAIIYHSLSDLLNTPNEHIHPS